jgi:plasmid stability protein
MYVDRMKTLQIRNVPDDIHRKLKVRAAEEGSSLSELALGELRRSLQRPTRRELLERLARRTPVEVEGGVAAVVRAERDGR